MTSTTVYGSLSRRAKSAIAQAMMRMDTKEMVMPFGGRVLAHEMRADNLIAAMRFRRMLGVFEDERTRHIHGGRAGGTGVLGGFGIQARRRRCGCEEGKRKRGLRTLPDT